jgi:FlaG/FlaF family flagellin (archaellin)
MIAMILLVAITVVLAAVLYVLVSGLARGPGATPIGTVFAVANPSSGKCWAAGVTNHVCGTAGDQLWNLTIEASKVTLKDVMLEVKTSSGSIYKNSLAAGFAIMPLTGTTPVAYYSISAGAGLAMAKTFTISAGYSASTPISTTMYIVIGTGTAAGSWAPGQGNYVTVVGTGSYSGTTAAEVLP